MDRLTLLRQATRLAHEQVDDVSALSDGAYNKLDLSDEEKAIAKVAHEILEDAAFELE